MVTGVDIDPLCIKICNLIKEDHPDYKINFFQTHVEDFIPAVKEDEYDLVLCFSILHWVTKSHGLQFVQDLIADLAKKIPNGIFEFALHSENLNDIPVDYREYLHGYPFIRILAYHDLIKGYIYRRPLCFASNKYVYFEALGILQIDEVISSAYHSRTICFKCEDKFVKYFDASPKFHYNLPNAQRELHFLEDLGGQNGLPKLRAILNEQDEAGTRIFLVRDMVEGVSLKEKLESGEDVDRLDVIKQVLQWMIFLEQHGYCYGDHGTNNFIYGDDGKLYLIDYENIYTEFKLPYYPDFRMRFFSFMASVLAAPSSEKPFSLLTGIKKYVSPEMYQKIVAIKDTDNFYERLYEVLSQYEKIENAAAAYDMKDMEILEIESGLSEVDARFMKHNYNFAMMNEWIQVIGLQQQRIERLERIINERLK